MTYQLSIFSQHSYCHFAGKTSLAKTLPFAHSHLPKKFDKMSLRILVGVKRVIDYAVKIRTTGTGVVTEGLSVTF